MQRVAISVFSSYFYIDFSRLLSADTEQYNVYSLLFI